MTPVLGLVLTMSTVYTCLITFLAFAAIAIVLFNWDTKIEKRRKHAIDIADKCREEGFEIMPDILRCYAVGDYSGLYDEIKGAYKIFGNDKLRRQTFFDFLERQLEISLKDPERRAAIYKAVEQRKLIDQAEDAAAAERARLTASVPGAAGTIS